MSRVRIRRQRELNLVDVRLALQAEDDQHLRVGSARAQAGKITIAVEHNPVEPAIEVQAIPVRYPPGAICLSTGNQLPAVIAGSLQAHPDAIGRLSVHAIQYLRANLHSTTPSVISAIAAILNSRSFAAAFRVPAPAILN